MNRKQREQDLAREIEDHLQLEAEERQASGMTSAESAYAARKSLGNATAIKEEVREVWGWMRLEAFRQDLKYATRMFFKNPGFTAVAVLTLALGIGANTAIFTVVNSLMLKPLPFKEPDRLVVLSTIFQRLNSDRGAVSYPDFQDWKAQTDLFEAVSVFNHASFEVTGSNEPERIRGLTADHSFFNVFTDPPLIGRTFSVEEDAPGTNRVVVLSYALWMRRFGGDGSVLGQVIELGGEPHRIIGVMPNNATWPEDVEIFKPIGFGQTPPDQRRDNHVFRVIARLQPGVPVEQAQAKLTAMGTRIAKIETNRAGTNWKVHPLSKYIIGDTLGRTLWILLAAVLLVLLIACLNVANLLLARGAGRQREVAIRNALGAGWRRLARQFLTESFLLAMTGGVAGVMLGYAGVRALVRFAPTGVPRLDNVQIDSVVLGFTILLCLLTTAIFGLVPVLSGCHNAPIDGIRDGGRSSSEGVRATRLRSVLVVSELALAIILVASAGLLVRSFQRLQRVDPGFATKNLLTLQVALPRSRYAERPQFVQGFDEITESIRRVPGVVSTAAISSLPIGGGGFYLGRVFLTLGQPEPPASSDTPASWTVMQPQALETMGVPLISGRAFDNRDTEKSNPVILISRSMAKQMFPNENPLGRRIRSWRDENVYREIVGVVGDVRYGGLGQDVVNNVYIPYMQDSWRAMVLVIRTSEPPDALLRSIQGAIWSRDNKLAISEVRTMDQIVNRELARPRFSMFLLGVFAATALIMAAIGIYGLMAYSVAQRTREIGIRMALGALRQDIIRSVASSALGLALTGVAIGIIGAVAVTRTMSALLFGVSPTDTGTFAFAAVLLIAVTMLAAFVPARRASKVDPMIALRYE